MKVTLPADFYALTKKQQENYLEGYLVKYYAVTDDIKKLLGKIRGEYRKITEEDVN